MDKMMGETSLHIWDIHVDETHQRKGLGKHLLTLMELIARRCINNITTTTLSLFRRWILKCTVVLKDFNIFT